MEGVREATGMPVPVPLRMACCGLPTALSVTVIAPVNVPVLGGVNVTLIVHIVAGASVLGLMGHVFVWAKLPETDIPEMVSAVVPLLRNEITCGALVVPDV